MRALLLLIPLAALSPRANADAPACPLEGCALAASLHAPTAHTTAAAIEEPRYAHLAHDLALARLALHEGDPALALELAGGAQLAVRGQADWIARARGAAYTLDLHRALAEVIVAAGGERPEPPAVAPMN